MASCACPVSPADGQVGREPRRGDAERTPHTATLVDADRGDRHPAGGQLDLRGHGLLSDGSLVQAQGKAVVRLQREVRPLRAADRRTTSRIEDHVEHGIGSERVHDHEVGDLALLRRVIDREPGARRLGAQGSAPAPKAPSPPCVSQPAAIHPPKYSTKVDDDASVAFTSCATSPPAGTVTETDGAGPSDVSEVSRAVTSLDSRDSRDRSWPPRPSLRHAGRATRPRARSPA